MIRYEFIDESTRVTDIHPGSSFVRELELAEAFVRQTALPTNGIDPCPFSGLRRHETLFRKWGMYYALCPRTWSLALSNDPGEAVLDDYFRRSDLAKFRATEEYQATVSRTRAGLWASQIEWIEGRIVRYLGKNSVPLLDYGTKAAGWIEALRRSNAVSRLSVLAPLPPVQEQPPAGRVSVVLLLDVLQRYFHPEVVMRAVWEALEPGGLLIGTCRAGSGFDILTLRESSESVYPFDHVALPSPAGIELQLRQSGFNVLEITTPGLLDAQLVKNREADMPTDQYFQRFLTSTANALALERLQHFLQTNGLSSHLRFVAQKPA